MITLSPTRQHFSATASSRLHRGAWLGVVLVVLWLGFIAYLEMNLVQGAVAIVPNHLLMAAPMAVGVAVLAFMLSRANGSLAEQNGKLARAERAAARLAAELETVLQSITELLVVTDQDGRVVRVNQAFATQAGEGLLNLGREGVQQSGSSSVTREDGAVIPRGEFPHERALAGETVENETIVAHREGAQVYYLVSASPIRDPETGQVSGAVTLMRDISSLKRLERLKDEFLYTVSHELRTPLAVIRGYAELSLSSADHPADETSSLALRRILAEVDQMSGLLEQMLQIARLDAGRMPIDAAEVDLAQLTAAELNVLSITPEYARVVLNLEEGTRRLICRLDRVAYRQVLGNLLSNALKYSPAKSPVVVRISAVKDQAVVSVSDCGSGIPEDELLLIFEKFYRARNAVNSGNIGLGLGLYITGRLVDLLSGRIWVESTLGHGSTFHVAFPLVLA